MGRTCKRKFAAIGQNHDRFDVKKAFQTIPLAGFLCLTPLLAGADGHGLAMHGAPELSTDFTHLPYADPNAPKGGEVVFGEIGGFDNLNPYILKGTYPWEVRTQTFESLMTRNWDEAFTLYGLLAERVEVADDRSWIIFHLNAAARFSDGTPVTVEDVMFSIQVLSEKGRPPYFNSMKSIAAMEPVGERGVKFTFADADREAPLIVALRPILKKAEWEGRVFEDTTLTPIIGSGAYVVDEFEAGRSITLRRNPDYWGKDLPINAGVDNFDTLRIEYFRDGAALWEAFKGGEVSVFRDGDSGRWRDGYDFAAANEGRITRSEVPHSRPTGMTGFVFNTRNPLFQDLRVREALTLAFDFEWIQKTMLAGANKRIPSYFGNSALAHEGAATEAERGLLAPFEASLPEWILDAATEPPVSQADGRNRRNLRKATALLKDAGWRLIDGKLVNVAGEPFRFEILLRYSTNEKVAGVFTEALKRLGVSVSVRLIDSAQHASRLTNYDFDMIFHGWSLSLSPGIEQRKYWGGAEGQAPGSRNHMGVDDPAVDAMIEALVQSRTRNELVAAARALDRVLSAGRYVIPFWYAPASRIAHDAELAYPEQTPLYGDWTGFSPDVWWRVPSE
jgi:peptide/nickel transport system substrate-binding protein